MFFYNIDDFVVLNMSGLMNLTGQLVIIKDIIILTLSKLSEVQMILL